MCAHVLYVGVSIVQILMSSDLLHTQTQHAHAHTQKFNHTLNADAQHMKALIFTVSTRPTDPPFT